MSETLWQLKTRRPCARLCARRCPARCQASPTPSPQRPCCARLTLAVQVSQDHLDDCWIFYSSHYPHLSLAAVALRYLDPEYPLEPLRPSHPPAACRRCVGVIACPEIGAPDSSATPLARCDQTPVRTVGGEQAMTNSSGMNLDSFSWPA
jgi:hypothetical protein